MKHLFLMLSIFVLSTQVAVGQVIELSQEKSPQELFNFHTLKQNKNKKAAWKCLSGGAILVVTGAYAGVGGFANEKSGLAVVGVAAMAIGSIATIASIPLYISAGNHKRKARMSLQSGTVAIGNLSFIKPKHLSLGLTIPL
jgi:hypothetical protein